MSLEVRRPVRGRPADGRFPMPRRLFRAAAVTVLLASSAVLAGTGPEAGHPSVCLRCGDPIRGDAALRLHAARFGLLDSASLAGLAPTDDPLLRHQVYLRTCRFPQAWKLVREAALPAGPAVRVAVLDFGFALPHPDLPAPDDAAAPDGAGRGGPGASVSSSRTGPARRSVRSHGNQSLGLIGALADNGTGIRGAAPEVALLPFETADPLQAAGAVLLAVRRGARVLNLSWDCAAHPALRSALLAASAAGCVVVLAVPNDARNLDRAPSFPLSCAFPGMLGVIACDTLAPNKPLAVSAWGARSARLAAPGDSILTTVAPPDFGFVEGTSAAAPLVSAAAALVLRCAPWLRGPEVAALLVATVHRTPALTGACVSGGVLDAEAAVRAALRLVRPVRGSGSSTADGDLITSTCTQRGLRPQTRTGITEAQTTCAPGAPR